MTKTDNIRLKCRNPPFRAFTTLLLSLLLTACAIVHTRTVLVPDSIQSMGGLYVPWSPQHEGHARAVLACVGLPVEGWRPSLWIVGAYPYNDKGERLAATYNAEAHAIIMAPDAAEIYWPVFRHEMIHAALRSTEKTGHGPVFDMADTCSFWPTQ